jgi:lipid-A-disaccharide synthase-like uncharacterized protein
MNLLTEATGFVGNVLVNWLASEHKSRDVVVAVYQCSLVCD